MNIRIGFLVAALVGALVSGVSVQASVLINGAGATFPAPIYTKWFQDYNTAHPNVEINYQSIGSGGGIKQLTERTVDFGASDAPMSDAELTAAGGDIVHIPTVLGAVVLSYNLKDMKSAIQLDSETLSAIFRGKILQWSDPKIAALNKNVTLPEIPIVVVYRSDSSGTTAVFTDYLAKVSPEWAKDVGQGKTVKWPMGLGGKGNEGVTAQIKNTTGAIGYIELTYAMTEKMPMAKLKNKSGAFVDADLKSVSAAAAGAMKTMPDDFRVSITNADSKDAYPISSFTYLLVRKTMAGEKGVEFVKFLGWAMDAGQKQAAKNFYAPLPAQLVPKVKSKIAKVDTK